MTEIEDIVLRQQRLWKLHADPHASDADRRKIEREISGLERQKAGRGLALVKRK